MVHLSHFKTSLKMKSRVLQPEKVTNSTTDGYCSAEFPLAQGSLCCASYRGKRPLKCVSLPSPFPRVSRIFNCRRKLYDQEDTAKSEAGMLGSQQLSWREGPGCITLRAEGCGSNLVAQRHREHYLSSFTRVSCSIKRVNIRLSKQGHQEIPRLGINSKTR